MLKSTVIYFNTTLVTVYQFRGKQDRSEREFQYNSCYCLSWWIMKKNHQSCYFNTTLVTVYLISYRESWGVNAFQYNSCYCLSFLRLRFRRLLTAFQYNSCYCLSQGNAGYVNHYMKFQYNSCYCLSQKMYKCKQLVCISIQLLLLFIFKKIETLEAVAAFQYNSCYCLSILQAYIFNSFS